MHDKTSTKDQRREMEMYYSQFFFFFFFSVFILHVKWYEIS